MGIAWATVFINTSLPTLEIVFSFHPITLFVICSCRSLKVFTLDFPPTIGRPRYFSQFVITCAPNKFWISSLTFGVVFLLKKIVVFCLLIACLDASSYCVRISRSYWHSPLLASQNNRLSSVKRRWEIRTPSRQLWMPFNLLVVTAFVIIEDSPSAQNKKR